VFDELFPEHHIYEDHGLALLIAVLLFASHTMVQICRTHLSYVGPLANGRVFQITIAVPRQDRVAFTCIDRGEFSGKLRNAIVKDTGSHGSPHPCIPSNRCYRFTWFRQDDTYQPLFLN